MFEINLIFYSLSSMLQFSQFVWALSYSVWDVFNNFLLIDATDISKISRDQKRFFIALSLYPLSFFANTPFKQSLPKLADIVTVLFLSSLTSKLLSRMLIVLLLPKYTFNQSINPYIHQIKNFPHKHKFFNSFLLQFFSAGMV